jgi:hypothetical protein
MLYAKRPIVSIRLNETACYSNRLHAVVCSKLDGLVSMANAKCSSKTPSTAVHLLQLADNIHIIATFACHDENTLDDMVGQVFQVDWSFP